MEATSINQVDWKFQKGVARPVMPRKFPFVSGFDLAGEIVELGAGVSEFKPGDKVIAFNFPKGGGLAEYAVASASLTVARPPEVSAAQGACLPIAAVAALRSLQTAGVTLDDPAASPRKNVPVTAASGGVGHFAVQLARLGGHHVTATPSGRKYDAVVHCAAAAGVPWSVFLRALADAGGKVVDITPGFAAGVTAILQMATFSKKRLVPLLVTPTKEDMELVVGLVKQGRLAAVIDSSYPLSRAQEGWARSMSGHATGKVVVEMGGAE
ncbi:unnamed protein product [Urochloa decumbens]|uniref:Enoyl reductase (ER) domain-containing protein n=1 Tax=Urochloa decumbens TaxID=240449 RepID=A0ABC9G5E9_9POAL